jgi:uncharacterized SAM-binding protein YcdF (DUF218 family)
MIQKLLKRGFVRRKECWTLTLWGWLLIGTAFCLVVLLTLRHTGAFLSVTSPVPADVLVVEGWLPDYALEAAVSEFNTNKYRLLITSGGPLPKGDYLSEYKTYAGVAAATIRKMGLESEAVVAVPAPWTRKSRTYASAIAVKNWAASNAQIKAINVVTMSLHARRTRLAFEKVFGDSVTVGIISVPNPDYDATHWWRSGEGVREVLGEGIAYIYARFFFSAE